jgi:pimeloyl-ACP methyl ester carboxylesterase
MTTELVLLRDRTVTLPDGRIVAYAEYGNPTGRPIIFFHGTPSGRLINPQAIKAGFGGTRLIAIDRPGYGRSDVHTEGGMLEWAADVVWLADTLEIDQFAVLGTSGGGPYAAACAYKYPQRVSTVILVSCPAPYLPDRSSEAQPANATDGLDEDAVAARSMSWPEFLKWFTDRQGTARPDVEEVLILMANTMSEVDKRVISLPEVQASFRTTYPNSFRQGIVGWAWDVWTLSRPWGFRFEDMCVPTFLWQGELDQAVVADEGRYLAATIPNCKATFCSDVGHLFPPNVWESIYTPLITE